MAITKEQIENMLAKIEDEGFDYYFNHYSNCDEINDIKFHKLRNNMMSARNEFRKYIINIAKKHIDDDYIIDLLGE